MVDLRPGAGDLRRWVADQAAAEARQRRQLRERPPSRRLAISHAVALIDLAAWLHGWPPPEDPVRQRESREALEAWARLRRRSDERRR